MLPRIPLNRAHYSDLDRAAVDAALASSDGIGNGRYGKVAERTLAEIHVGAQALLTPSCTAALELAARLLNLQPGDEVIVPSFTFVSTASAFVWNGARPVFADVMPETLNLDLDCALSRISPRTRAICTMHYGGIANDPNRLIGEASSRGIAVIEDNAHGLGASYEGQPLGTFGAMSSLSFHGTKNVTCGEGGALIVNDTARVDEAEVLREKGTNRARFLRGAVDKYTWVGLGSSWVMSDFQAALLQAQLSQLNEITRARVRIWNRYRVGLADWAEAQGVRLPAVPVGAEHPGHLFYLRMPCLESRTRLIEALDKQAITAAFHYQALHDSPVGRELDPGADCPESSRATDDLVRLPLFSTMTDTEQERVIEALLKFRS